MTFFKAVTTVGGFTLASRFLGLLRDILTAGFLGAGPIADAFFIALKLPNFFRRITAEGAFSVSFVPMFSKMLHDRHDARRFAEEAQAMMIAWLLPFTIICVIAMPWILRFIVPGIYEDPVRYMHAVEFSRITFPYILMISLTALLGGVLNSLDRFAAFAVAPIFFNIVLIITLLCSETLFATTGHALSYGVFAAGIVQFIWMIYNAKKSGYVLKLRKPKITRRMRKLYRLMVPGVVGAGAVQINMIIDMVLASLLPVGSISLLYYADRLYQLPLGVIGIAIGTALLPMLSKSLREDNGSSKRLFGMAFESALAFALPSAVGLIVMAEPIISVLFERGEFLRIDTIKTSYALMAYSAGLPAYVLARVFSVAYFARENTRTPVKFAIISAVINIILALILVGPFQHVGIAMATGVSAWINLGLLIYRLHKNGHLELPRKSIRNMFKIMFCTAIMGAITLLLDSLVYDTLMESRFINKALMLTGVITIANIVYFSSLYLTGVFKLLSIKAVFSKRGNIDIKDITMG